MQNYEIRNFNAIELIRSLTGMVFAGLIDPPFSFLYASEGTEALTGYEPDELTRPEGVRFLDMVVPEDVAKINELAKVTLLQCKPLETSFRLVTKQGEQKWAWIFCRVSETDSNGMPYIIEGFCKDISRQFRAESAKLANRANFDFLTRISHEIRTPLNAVIGMAEISLRSDISEKNREQVDVIKASGRKIINLLNEVVDYAHITTGEMTIYEREYKLSTLVNDILDAACGLADAKGLQFLVRANSSLPDILLGDNMRLRRVIYNLLDNSIKFTDEGYILFGVDGEIEGDVLNLTITVEDTGRGIRDEDIRDVFKEFTQFDTKTLEGSGVGLATAQQLIEKLGGSIGVSSFYGVGTMFTITISQKIVDLAPMCAVFEPDGKSVLVFDGRERFLESFEYSLSILGVPHHIAGTFEEFLAELGGDRHYEFAFIQGSLVADVPSVENTKIVPVNSYGDESDFDALVAPITCLPIADILNGTSRIGRSGTVDDGRVGFTAPDARILIVDDVSMNITVARELLSPFEMHIDIAESGADAIEAVKNNDYDLVLMDLLMPVMNGIEATRVIREIKPDVPVVVLTATVDSDARERFKRSGFSDFIPKPIQPSMLNRAIEKWVPKYKQIWITEEAAVAEAPKRTINFESALEFDAPQASIFIEGIDADKGLSLLDGNITVYTGLLEKYYTNGRTLSGQLADCVKSEDIGLYTIYVHALKSISDYIGADDVAALALMLEKAGQNGDLELIKTRTPELLGSLEVILNNVKTYLRGGERKTVLLIDDMDSFLLVLEEMLKDEYDVLVSLDGEDGLETAKVTMPDLVILDIMMPGMSGYEVLEALKADDSTASIPVILCSSTDSQEDLAKRTALGACGFIKKPFTKDVVRNAADAALK
ncbi:MAG: response regulator [Defluviitaleaceae bacterium]|nr:response regulator [Defluviitaleaceae bacterium]